MGAPTSVVVAIAARPDGTSTVLAVVLALLSISLVATAAVITRARRPRPVGDGRPEPLPNGVLEPPAVVGALTSGYRTPDVAVTATLLDLAAREWVRLAVVDGSVVVLTRDAGRAGDPLRPFEQQVLNHVAGRAVGGVTTPAALVAARSRLDRSWWRRFRREVARSTRRLGLTTPRYTPANLAPAAVASLLAAGALAVAVASGDDAAAVSDSIPAISAWLTAAAATVVGVVTVLRAARSDAQRPTAIGEHRADQWLGYRHRLAVRVPDRATPVAPRDAQAALAHAHAMGLAPHLGDELPIVAEDPYHAWSDAAEVPRVVRVRYPWWPSYGRAPIHAIVLGATITAAALAARVFAVQVADGEALASTIDDLGDWTGRIETAARVLGALLLVPLVWGVCSLLAGVVDALWVQRRSGAVVRVRDPYEVAPLRRRFSPFGFRDRVEWFMAVDDGRRATVLAWIADERAAAPQGSRALVESTRVLGRVRTSEPVGTAGHPGSVPPVEGATVAAWPHDRARPQRQRRHRPRSFS